MDHGDDGDRGPDRRYFQLQHGQGRTDTVMPRLPPLHELEPSGLGGRFDAEAHAVPSTLVPVQLPVVGLETPPEDSEVVESRDPIVHLPPLRFHRDSALVLGPMVVPVSPGPLYGSTGLVDETYVLRLEPVTAKESPNAGHGVSTVELDGVVTRWTADVAAKLGLNGVVAIRTPIPQDVAALVPEIQVERVGVTGSEAVARKPNRSPRRPPRIGSDELGVTAFGKELRTPMCR